MLLKSPKAPFWRVGGVVVALLLLLWSIREVQEGRGNLSTVGVLLLGGLLALFSLFGKEFWHEL